MKKSEKRSPVIELLDHVYAQSMKADPRSWQRINNAMRDALGIAIGSLFEFAGDDFKYIVDHYRSGYWLGEDVERWYSECVASGNSSAYMSFEKMKGNRAPLIADSVDPVESKFAHVTGIRAKERLHVGASFTWKGHRVTVTSFSSDGSCTACAYATRDSAPEQTKEVTRAMHVLQREGWSVNWYSNESRKPIRRFKITRDDLIADRAERKRRDEIESEMQSLCVDNAERAAAILEIAGFKSRYEFELITLKKLEAALVKVKKAFSDE